MVTISTTLKNMDGIFLLLFCVCFQVMNAANLFDAFSSSVRSLFTEEEEAPFTLIKKDKKFEERRYDSLTWVCANASDIKDSSAQQQQETFLKLFSYIQGENDEGVKIDMTIPVSIEYSHELKQEGASPTLSACFYIGNPFQKSPPIPNDPSLSIVKRDPVTIYTREVGGFLEKPSEWLKEAKALLKIVEAAGGKIRRDLMFWNAFDSPVKLWSRRNEVWLVKQI